MIHGLHSNTIISLGGGRRSSCGWRARLRARHVRHFLILFVGAFGGPVGANPKVAGRDTKSDCRKQQKGAPFFASGFAGSSSLGRNGAAPRRFSLFRGSVCVWWLGSRFQAQLTCQCHPRETTSTMLDSLASTQRYQSLVVLLLASSTLFRDIYCRKVTYE